jgi:hypothetical protein
MQKHICECGNEHEFTDIREWKCQDEKCAGREKRDYDTLVEAGSPYCPVCECDMELAD